MRMTDVETLLNRHGFPLYIYDSEAISGRISRLKEVFNGFDILYSMKCNSNDAVCRHITAHGLGIDAASKNEVLAAHFLGVPSDKILFSAPGKSDEGQHQKKAGRESAKDRQSLPGRPCGPEFMQFLQGQPFRFSPSVILLLAQGPLIIG